ncbi:MAG: hypothetical protein IJ337_03435, partial [Clostridia bacterium]|nr:hypothetical protein [Clostridia bacterium]
LTGKYDQARKYYKKILEAQPNMQDYLNAGHTEWVLQNNKAALDFYKQAVEKENGDWFKFYNQFEQDIPYICLYWRAGALLSRSAFTDARDIRELELLRGVESFGTK